MKIMDAFASNPSPTAMPAASPLTRLQRLARPRAPQEQCDLCGIAVAPQHEHLLEAKTRQIFCACEACAILFSGDATTRFRRVPRRITRLDQFQLSDEQWEMLRLPINLVFFYRDSRAGKIAACYPSPGGATESTLPLDAWDELTSANPALARMQPDVEALLINRIGKRRDAFCVPIDQCFKLVGVIRTHWRGLAGGPEVWRQVDLFFDELHRLAARKPGVSHA